LNTIQQRLCNHCGIKLADGSRFCEACGHAVNADRPTSQLAVNENLRRSARARSINYNHQRLAWSLIFFLLIIPIVFFLIYKDLGELNSDLWMSLGFFIVITTVLAIYTLRKASRTWQGELLEKVEISRGARLVFRTDRGKRINLVAGSRLAVYFHIGDRVIKIKGYDYPEKIDRNGNLQLCVACGTPYPITEKRCPGCRYQAIDPQHYI